MSVLQVLDEIDENQTLCESNVRLVTGQPRYSLLLADSSEYQEGEAASCRDLTTRNNPYPFRSPEYWRWQEGLMGNCRPRESQATPEPDNRGECDGGEGGLAGLIDEPPILASSWQSTCPAPNRPR
jgi:hypothetical protein